MSETIILESARLRLAPVAMTDASDIQRLFPDPEVTRYLSNIPSPYPDNGAVSYIGQRITGRASTPSLFLAIRCRTRHEFLGTIEIRHDPLGMAGNIGYWLGRPHWGRGIMTEAVHVVLGHVFSALCIRLVHLSADARNTASRRIALGAGFLPVLERRTGIWKDGAPFVRIHHLLADPDARPISLPGHGLALRPLSLDDRRHLNGLYTDPMTRRFMPVIPPVADGDIGSNILAFAALAGSESRRYDFAVRHPKAGFIGHVFASREAGGETWTIAYALDRKSRGRGHGTEAARTLVAFLFEAAGAQEIRALVVPENTASLRIVKSLGFSKVGMHRFVPGGPELSAFETIDCRLERPENA